MLLLYSLFVLTLLAGIEAKGSLVIHGNAESELNSTFSIRTEEDQPELMATWKYLSNVTRDYICAYNSTWFVYYSVEGYGVATLVYFSGCGSVPPGIHAGSARLVGEPGVQKLTLYYGSFCTYNATTLLTNQPVISTWFRSLAFVGNVPVQLYLQPNYGGFSYCVQTSSGQFSGVANIATIGLQPGDVKSIRFGCTADAMVIERPWSNMGEPVNGALAE